MTRSVTAGIIFQQINTPTDKMFGFTFVLVNAKRRTDYQKQ